MHQIKSMFRAYLLLNSEQEELLKYESFKLQMFNYSVVFFSCIGVCKTCTWIYEYITYFYRVYYTAEQQLVEDNIFKLQKSVQKQTRSKPETASAFKAEESKPGTSKRKNKLHSTQEENVTHEECYGNCVNGMPTVDFNLENAKIPDTPSPESIMGVAAAAATAATVFMDKKRTRLHRKCAKD